MTSERDSQPVRMRLSYSALSPFVRKVLVAAHETDLFERLDVAPIDVWSQNTDIGIDSPLGKVPALVAPEGVIIGSSLICEYLNALSGSAILLPTDANERWPILIAHALADGVMEAAVAHVVERIRRPQEKQWPGWLERQEGKIDRALAQLAAQPVASREPLNLYTVTLGCTLAYLDRRLPAFSWRERQPVLSTWLDRFADRPSMTATRPPPA